MRSASVIGLARRPAVAPARLIVPVEVPLEYDAASGPD